MTANTLLTFALRIVMLAIPLFIALTFFSKSMSILSNNSERASKHDMYKAKRNSSSLNFSSTSKVHTTSAPVKDENSCNLKKGMAHLMDPTKNIIEMNRLSPNSICILDLSERMENIAKALRRLVHLGVDADFNVVEPFIFSRSIRRQFAFPGQFLAANMTPQPASLFFHTDVLYNTNRYISYSVLRDRIHLHHQEEISDYVIHAAVFFDWMEHDDKSKQPSTNGKIYFHTCNHHLQRLGMQKSKFGWSSSQQTHIHSAVCVSPKLIMNPSFFASLFEFVKKTTKSLHGRLQCESCISVALVNYHLSTFASFVSNMNWKPKLLTTPSLFVGRIPLQLAHRVWNDALHQQPYIAIHFNTREAFNYFHRHQGQKTVGRDAPRMGLHARFGAWLQKCVYSVSRTVHQVASISGNESKLYIATDVYNNGWSKHGEENHESHILYALEQATQAIHQLEQEVGSTIHFVPHDFGVTQDVGGMAAAVDAAMSLRADKFAAASPSKFALWVHDQRSVLGDVGNTFPIDCGFVDRNHGP